MVTLPRNVGKAIENLRSKGSTKSLFNYPNIILHSKTSSDYKSIAEFIQFNDKTFGMYFEALVNGYELEASPEEQIKALYLNNKEYGLRAEAKTIRNVLNILGIKIEGVNE